MAAHAWGRAAGPALAAVLLCFLGLGEAEEKDIGPAPKFRHLGCFRDADLGEGRRVIPTLEHTHEAVNGNYKGRRDAVSKCAIAAWAKGLPGFCIQDGGWCGGSADIMEVYDKYGPADMLQPPYRCERGQGGIWANDVYELLGHIDEL